MAKTVTFYSYKGGVGRSMALANVAYLLAAKGRRVFLLDFDLEAPGLDSLFKSTSKQTSNGIVEYISSYKSTQKVPELDDFVVKPEMPGISGKIFLMPAGRKDENYQIELHKLNWKDFYRKDDGFYLIENLKGEIIQKYKPDYIFVDSRTGMTDAGGICTLQLPDIVVLMFGFNEQNITGIKNALNSIQYNKLGRDIKTLLVASPVPDVPAKDSLLESRVTRAREAFGVQQIDLRIRYTTTLALNESILALENPDAGIVEDYRKIADRIAASNPLDFEKRLESVHAMLNHGKMQDAITEVAELNVLFPENYSVQLSCAMIFRLVGNYSEALKSADRAHKIRPDGWAALIENVRALMALQRNGDAKALLLTLPLKSEGRGNDQVFLQLAELHGRLNLNERALAWYRAAATTGQTINLVPACEYGSFLIRLKKYAAATEVLKAVVKAHPKSLPVIFNLGMAEWRGGHRSEARKHFREAIAQFELSKDSASAPHFQANFNQAMHYAYEALGDKVKAIKCLEIARVAAAKLAGAKIEIFSPTTYRLLPVKEFLQENHTLLLRLTKRSAIIPSRPSLAKVKKRLKKDLA